MPVEVVFFFKLLMIPMWTAYDCRINYEDTYITQAFFVPYLKRTSANSRLNASRIQADEQASLPVLLLTIYSKSSSIRKISTYVRI